MAQEVPGTETLTLARIGHTPTLGEPASREAIARLLAQVA